MQKKHIMEQEVQKILTKHLLIDDVVEIILDYIDLCEVCYKSTQTIDACVGKHRIIYPRYELMKMWRVATFCFMILSLPMAILTTLVGRTCTLQYDSYILQNDNRYVNTSYKFVNLTTYNDCLQNNTLENGAYLQLINISLSYQVYVHEPVVCVNDAFCWQYSICNDLGITKVDGFNSCHKFTSIPANCFYIQHVYPFAYCANQAIGFYNEYKTCTIYNAMLYTPDYYKYYNTLYYIKNDTRVDISQTIYECFNTCDNYENPFNGTTMYIYNNKMVFNFYNLHCEKHKNNIYIFGMIVLGGNVFNILFYNWAIGRLYNDRSICTFYFLMHCIVFLILNIIL